MQVNAPFLTDLTLTGTKYVNEGDMIRLICNFTTSVSASVDLDWFFNGNKVKESDAHWRDRVTMPRRTAGQSHISELIVERSVHGDTGMYLCRAPNLWIQDYRVDVLVGKICTCMHSA